MYEMTRLASVDKMLTYIDTPTQLKHVCKKTMAGRRSNAVAVNQGDKAIAPASQRGRGASGTRNRMKDFNPKLIFSQIVAIQCFHYLFLGFIFQVNHVLFSTTVTIDRIFTGKYLNLWSVTGWTDNAAILLSYVFG
jgi:hypothetical protein